MKIVYGTVGYGLAVVPHSNQVALRPLEWGDGFILSRAGAAGLVKVLQEWLDAQEGVPAPIVHDAECLYSVRYLVFALGKDGKLYPYEGSRLFPCNSPEEALALYDAFARFRNDTSVRDGVYYCPAWPESVQLIAMAEKSNFYLAG